MPFPFHLYTPSRKLFDFGGYPLTCCLQRNGDDRFMFNKTYVVIGYKKKIYYFHYYYLYNSVHQENFCGLSIMPAKPINVKQCHVLVLGTYDNLSRLKRGVSFRFK